METIQRISYVTQIELTTSDNHYIRLTRKRGLGEKPAVYNRIGGAVTTSLDQLQSLVENHQPGFHHPSEIHTFKPQDHPLYYQGYIFEKCPQISSCDLRISGIPNPQTACNITQRCIALPGATIKSSILSETHDELQNEWPIIRKKAARVLPAVAHMHAWNVAPDILRQYILANLPYEPSIQVQPTRESKRNPGVPSRSILASYQMALPDDIYQQLRISNHLQMIYPTPHEVHSPLIAIPSAMLDINNVEITPSHTFAQQPITIVR